VKNSSRKDQITDIFQAAVQAVQPSRIIPHVLKLHEGRLQVGEDDFRFDRFGKIYVAGAGKATAAMAYEVEKILTHHIEEGVIAVRDNFAFPLKNIRAIAGGHPLPNANSVMAAEEIVKVLNKLTSKDLLIFLLSGGASSLMFDLPNQFTIDEINFTIDALMRKGATIQQLNTVRKHLSALKGGQLIKKCAGATVIAFVMSDVVGNDVRVIGSAPTVGDDSTFGDAMAVIEGYELKQATPYSVISYLQKGIDGNIPENPKPGDKIFNTTRTTVVADNNKALQAAKEKAIELGYNAHIVTNSLTGNAEQVANEWVADVLASTAKQTCFIAGGETTVEVRGSGKGGRCQHFALSAAIALKNSSDITLLAAGTDGSDGPTDAAGAIVDSNTWDDAKQSGLLAENYLRDSDSYRFFEQTGALLKTGPTNTNVMDIVITII
jgi:glycerate 2-kinase